MKTNSKQYSFEDYSRLPQILVDKDQQDVNHTISTESFRHKKLDNDLLFIRTMHNNAPLIQEDAILLNRSNRSFGNFQSPMSGNVSNIGDLTRRESSLSQDSFLFKYNSNLKQKPPSRPLDTRILLKGHNKDIKDKNFALDIE